MSAATPADGRSRVKPFRFGVSVFPLTTAEAFRADARRAEVLGYSTLLVPDHPGHGIAAPIPALLAAADATERIRIGTSVLANDFRPPPLLAWELATLDIFSGGRLEVGLGAGWLEQDYLGFGLPFERPGLRISRLAESIRVIKQTWATGEIPDFAGEHYRFGAVGDIPKPVQQPHPPVLIGGGGRRLLSVAAKHADIIGIQSNMAAGDRHGTDAARSAGPEATRAKVQWIRDEAGDRFDSIELMALAPYARVGDDRAARAERVATAHGAGRDEIHMLPQVLLGTPAQIADDLRWRRAEFGISYVAVFIQAMNEMAPVIELLQDE